MIIRGSGIVAFLLLASATIWGLLVSTGLLGPWVKVKGLTFFHESVGLAALLATIVHLTALGFDEYIPFGPYQLFVPGASTWQPLATAFGVAAFYALALVSMSFYAKRWIGQARWRAIHFLAFGTFAAALVHGLLAGTDRANPAVFAMYVASAVAVIGLIAVRGATAAGKTPATPRRNRASEPS
jgi:methionine sulfoxide reductase heme-binding subunit